MATLQVTNLQNTAATVNNISLLADGTTSLVLNATGTARTGGIRYVGGFLEVYTSGGVWVPVAPGVAGTLAEAAAGTLNTVYSSPETAVPKDASGMTGAAIIPSGTDLQRPGTPVVGMQRYNTDSGYGEIYTGATNLWQRLNYLTSPSPAPANLTLSSTNYDDGVYVCNNLTVPAGVTATTTGQQLVFIVYGNAVIDGNISVNGKVPGAPTTQSNAGATANGSYGFNFGSAGGTYSAFLSGAGSGGQAGSAYSVPASSNAGRGGGGGYGGGGLIIKCYGSVTIGATSTLSATGGNGGNGSNPAGNSNGGGGGGGSGGLVAIYGGISLSAAGTINVSGGAGGAGASNYFPNDAYGGTGGGGGVIILESPGLTDSSTRVLSGGAAGANAIVGGGGASVPGGQGAGYGGAGGSLASPTSPQPGSTGIFLTSGFPI